MPIDGNLYAAFEKRFHDAGPAIAFSLPGVGDISYSSLAEQVSRMANALIALGIKPGDRVLVQVEKSLPNVLLYLATLKVGAVFNPLNTAYTTAELD